MLVSVHPQLQVNNLKQTCLSCHTSSPTTLSFKRIYGTILNPNMAIKPSLKVVPKLLFLKYFGHFSEPQSLILVHFMDEFHHFFFHCQPLIIMLWNTAWGKCSAPCGNRHSLECNRGTSTCMWFCAIFFFSD